MRIAVFGCGAMGSVYAARLAASGNTVFAVDRNHDHIAAIAAHGLRLHGPSGSLVADIRASSTLPADPVDLIVIAVKASGVAAAARACAGVVRDVTTVLTIQNGLGSAATVAEEVGTDRLAVGVASGFGAAVTAPGIVTHQSMKTLTFGAYAGLDPATLSELADTWRQAGFSVVLADDIAAVQWEKIICNAAYSAQCALTGMTVGQAIGRPDTARLAREAAIEAWEVAQAVGIRVPVADPVARIEQFAADMPNAKPSALLDHERGRRSEVEAINGAVVRLGRDLGVATPVNELLVSLVAARESLFAS